MTYEEIWRMVDGSGVTGKIFLGRLAVAAVHVSVMIKNEDPGTQNHKNRMIWQAQVRAGEHAPMTVISDMLWDIMANPVIFNKGVTATDEDLRNAVSAAVDLYATGG